MYKCPGVSYRFRGTAENPLNEITNHWNSSSFIGVLEVTEDHKLFETTLPDTGATKNRTVAIYELPDNYQIALVNHYFLHEGDNVIEEMNVRILNR